ncbi:acyl carrier protein [Actomonas aquatica]|uniref:Acyl carrier protein n=1 Tax=Actomonas aquatica TaxID=2866162 RepID=A0ABZ1CB93_9BACT|nr:acyl carrier protein [Opitutus sp. WL0086]WRQ88773.1 acyl carrier protein [Opitutus sp. WL0086]
MPSATLTSEADLRSALKRCRPQTIDAAVAYRQSGDAALLPVIITGVIERFVEPDLRPVLRSADDTLRLSEDLGLDSLTMMEIVLLAEEVFSINVSAEELRHLCTLGQIKMFIVHKARNS